MNLILLFETDFVSSHQVRLTDRRFQHIQSIFKAELGQTLVVGKINGLIGVGQITAFNKNFLEMDVTLQRQPPAALDLILIMALPRPPMLKRTLQCAASLGIKKIIILNFSRVEKNFWQASSLRPDAIQQQLVLGLQQAKDTVMPEVILKERLKPFVEDELPFLIKGRKAFVAHPSQKEGLPKKVSGGVVLIIGPEGGLVDFEVELLKSKGVQAVNLGSRILRFENVLPFAVGKMF